MPYKDPERQKAYFKERGKIYRATHRGEIYARAQEYQKTHPRQYRPNTEKRREQERGYRRRRREWLDAQKAKPCMDCGQSFPPCAMDFDHVRGVKKANVTLLRMSNASQEVMLEEIAKCDLVCANCHRIRTHVQSGV